MQVLSTSLAPSVAKKAGKALKTTQGKVVPVMRGAKPRKPITPKRPTPIGANSPSVNSLGVNKQQQNIESRPPVSTQMNVSYEADPVLARIKALGTQDVANARAEADALRKKAIIDSGLTDVGSEIGVDPATIQAAAANPFSTSALIKQEQEKRGRELDESLNQQNLFYGGHRATQLTDLANSGAQQQAALTGDIRGLLGGINSGVTEAEQAAALQEQEALAQLAEQQRMADLQQSYFDALYAPEPDVSSLLGAPFAPLDLGGDPNVAYTPTPEEELAMLLGGAGNNFNLAM